MLYGQNILSVCPCESICKRVSLCLSAAFVQPTGKGPRLPEVYCVISRLGCFDLFSTVSSVRLSHENAPYVSKLSRMKWLQLTCCWMSVQARMLKLYFWTFGQDDRLISVVLTHSRSVTLMWLLFKIHLEYVQNVAAQLSAIVHENGTPWYISKISFRNFYQSPWI